MTEMGDADSRRGRLLVASPSLSDDNFTRAVVLVLEHNDEGSLGLVLNKPTGLPAEEALPERISHLLPEGEQIHKGGPVQPEAVIVVADFVNPEHAASIAFDSVGIVDPEGDLGDLQSHVRTARAFGGYAGWGAGQLEREIDEEAWIDATGLAEDVFTREPDDLWRQVLERKGGTYRIVARMPDDPTLN
jgi:putative transcriptional regulator